MGVERRKGLGSALLLFIGPDITICFILRNVSHNGSEADVTFALHGNSRPAEAGQPTRQTAMVNN